MIRESFKCNTGILFHTHVLAELGLDVETLYPVLQKRVLPVCGPSPSAIDAYAAGHLPPIQRRAKEYRKHFKLSTVGANFPGLLNKPETFQDAPDGLAGECLGLKTTSSVGGKSSDFSHFLLWNRNRRGLL